MAGFCCPPGGLDRLPGLRYHTIGIGALAILVHPENPVDELSLDGARRLFSGSAASWADLPISGVASQPGKVRAIARLHCKPRPGHWRLILDNENLFAHDLFEVPSIMDMIQEVSRTPAAIGYETLWHVARLADRGKVKLVRLDGHDPRDDDAVASGAYPLYRVFNITTWEASAARKPLSDELAAYLIDHAEEIDPAYAIIRASRLRAAGWRFDGTEIVAEPDRR